MNWCYFVGLYHLDRVFRCTMSATFPSRLKLQIFNPEGHAKLELRIVSKDIQEALASFGAIEHC